MIILAHFCIYSTLHIKISDLKSWVCCQAVSPRPPLSVACRESCLVPANCLVSSSTPGVGTRHTCSLHSCHLATHSCRARHRGHAGSHLTDPDSNVLLSTVTTTLSAVTASGSWNLHSASPLSPAAAPSSRAM